MITYAQARLILSRPLGWEQTIWPRFQANMIMHEENVIPHSSGLLEILTLGVAFFAIFNLLALAALRAAHIRYEVVSHDTAIPQTQVDSKTQPEAVADTSLVLQQAGLQSQAGLNDHDNTPIVSNEREGEEDDVLPDQPLTPGRDVQRNLDKGRVPEPTFGPERFSLPANPWPIIPEAAPNNPRIKKVITPEVKRRENHMKSESVAAWLANSPLSLPRARLGPLPSRRPYAAPGALKQPRGLASCVIREDMPYPPANAEVTFEVRTTTVRHGRKVLRYAASSPLDTIYIKIPNTVPSSLQQPVLESLRHTIDLGYQRIVVGGGVRPGCTLMVLDILNGLGEPQEGFGDLFERQLTPEPGATAAAEALHQYSNGDVAASGDRTSWLGSLNGLFSERSVEAPRSTADHQHFAAVVASGLSRWLERLCVEVAPGMQLLLQHHDSVLEAKFSGEDEGWVFRSLPSTPVQAPSMMALGGAAAPARVSLSVERQAFVAPTSVAEPVRILVRVHGMSDLVAEVGTVGSGSERYSFMARSLGRYLPVLGVPAPTTPTLDLSCRFGSTEDIVSSLDADGNKSSGGGGGGGSALVAAVAAAAVAVLASDGTRMPEEAYEREGDADTAAAASYILDTDESRADGVALGTPDQHMLDGLSRPPAPWRGPHHKSVASGNGAASHWVGEAAPIPATEGAPAKKTVVAEPSCQYELTVTGLGTGHGGAGGSGSNAALLHLELWLDTSRLIASKPLLLLPPSLSGLASELQSLVWLQQELDDNEEEKAAMQTPASGGVQAAVAQGATTPAAAPAMKGDAAFECSSHNGSAVAANSEQGTRSTDVQPAVPVFLTASSARDASNCSGDQLVSDLGMWVEFVQDVLGVVQTEGAGAVTEQQQQWQLEDGAAGGDVVKERERLRAHSCTCQENEQSIILPGSLDLRSDVVSLRRRRPEFSAAMLRTGLGLLEAFTSYGSGPLVEHLLANFQSLGYGAAEVWEASARAAATADGSMDMSLLHLAAASGDVATLRAVVELADAAMSSSSSRDDSDESPWLLRDGDGRTPLHLLAAAAGDDTALSALKWALDSGGEAVHRAWLEARDQYGFTPAQVLAEMEAAALNAANTANGGILEDSLNRALPKLLPVPLQKSLVLASPSATTPASTAVSTSQFMWTECQAVADSHDSLYPATADEVQSSGCAAVTAAECTVGEEPSEHEYPVAGTGAVASNWYLETMASDLRGPAVAAEDWKRRFQCRSAAVVALLEASVLGFDAARRSAKRFSCPCRNGVMQPSFALKTNGAQMETADGSSAESMEPQYQAYVSRRTLMLAQGWVVLHLMLLFTAVRRLLADRRTHELAAPLLYSLGHMIMLVVLRAAPGFRLYLPHRGAWWALTAVLRTSSKVVQLVGWVTLPEATLRYVKGGATLVSDCVLPALFEPCPLPSAFIIIVYDFFVTTAMYLRIGYAADLKSALMKATFKCSVAYTLRLAMDLMHRSAFLTATARKADGDKASTQNPLWHNTAPGIKAASPSALPTAPNAFWKGKLD